MKSTVKQILKGFFLNIPVWIRGVVKSLWQDYNLVDELPGHPVVLSTFLFITPVHLKLLGSLQKL